MDRKIVTLALSVAVVIGGVRYLVYAPAPGTPVATCADLIDAGTASADCSPSIISCAEHFTPEGTVILASLGHPLPRPGQLYAQGATIELKWEGDDAGTSPGTYIPALSALGVTKAGDPHMQVMDMAACTRRPCDALCLAPFPIAWDEPPCVRRREDAGLLCLYRYGEEDGGYGVMNRGDGRVFPRENADDPAQCQPVSCGVWTRSEDPEDAL